MHRCICVLSALVLLWAAPLSGQTSVSQLPVLRPGDAVRITVWRKPDLSGEFFIASDSSIAHPLYTEVRVGGVPLAEAEARVRRFVERYETSPQVLVEPLFQVMVLGEVREPKLYTLRPEVTIAQAVGLAGGATDRGQLERARLLRDGEVFIVDLTRPDAELARAPIRSGDQIVISRRRDWFRDYVAPTGSVVAALATLINIVLTQ